MQRVARVERMQRRDRLAVRRPLLAGEQQRAEYVEAVKRDLDHVLRAWPGKRRLHLLFLPEVLGGEAERTVEVRYLGAPALADTSGPDRRVELEPKHGC